MKNETKRNETGPRASPVPRERHPSTERASQRPERPDPVHHHPARPGHALRIQLGFESTRSITLPSRSIPPENEIVSLFNFFFFLLSLKSPKNNGSTRSSS